MSTDQLGRGSSGAGKGGELPDLVTMPLLTKITQQSLDEDYQHVAERRREAAASGAPVADNGRRFKRSTAIAVAIFGLLVTTAAVQTSRNSDTDASSRAALISEIERRNAQVAEQETRLRNLHEQTNDLTTGLDRLTRDQQATAARVQRLKAATGFGSVTGPGVRAVVDDGPGDSGRVRDEDLAILVDGLWNAGAEAISINGQRLTALAPIRTSGVAIHVNNRPISPPYTVLAIGDTSSLQSRFADSTHGLEWLSLVNTLDFQFDMQNEDSLTIPGARMPMLRTARTPDEQSPGKEQEDAP